MKSRGFTLLEVMVGLALLGLALTVLIKSAAGSIFNAEQAHMIGVATDLARGKMYDIEEILMKDGFSDTDQSQNDEQCFEDEGWPLICYTYKVEEAKIPSFDELQALAMKQAEGSAAKLAGSAGSDALPAGIENSMLGGMLAGMGGGAQDIQSAQGAGLLQGQFSMFQEILKVSVRKVTLTVKWKVLGSDRDMKVVAFFTDAQAMDKVLSGMGSTEFVDKPATPTKGGGGGAGGGGKGK